MHGKNSLFSARMNLGFFVGALMYVADSLAFSAISEMLFLLFTLMLTSGFFCSSNRTDPYVQYVLGSKGSLMA